jgi:hypothetical protein
MKKISIALTLSLASIAAIAQDASNENKPIIDSNFMAELIRISGVLLGIFLFTSFFLAIIRSFLDSKLRNKLVDKGTTETVVSQLLQPLKKDNKLEPFKWFAILAGIGTGLSVINATQPLGLHSLAIMSFSLAASFLGYYFFSKKTEQ